MIVVKRQLSNFSAISWQEQVNFQSDDDDDFFLYLESMMATTTGHI
jgi:hypothetical protein